jgi:Kelch motif
MRTLSATRTVRSVRAWIWAGALAVALTAPGRAQAHFLWLTSEREDGKPLVRAFLSETPIPDGPEFLKRIEGSKITAAGRTLGWTKEEDTYRVELPEPIPQVVDGDCDLGVMKRNGATFRLIYTARVQFGAASGAAAAATDHLRLRLVARPGQTPMVAVSFRNKPAAGAIAKALPEDGDPIELRTDAQGRLEYPAVAEGKAGLLVKWTTKEPGELDGKSFDEIRYYATLTVAPAAAAAPSAAGDSGVGVHLASLPEAVDSFGASVLGDWLYVYGGHTGKTHKYSTETTAKHFRRLSLREGGLWEELPCGPALQGVTLMAHNGRLYRIGGMAPHNPPGAPNDLVSVADFARFDPASKIWTDLPRLPTARSTHDSVVVGNKIYVIGGWSMNGGGSAQAEFLDTALVFDLVRPGAEWETLPAPPFRRRALAVGAIEGKVYAIGGLSEAGKVVKAVDVFDPTVQTWSHGPDLPGSKRQGFAPSAFGVGGKLYVSGIDGQLLRLGSRKDCWEVVGKLAMPRLTHRLLPGIANDLLAVGGSALGAPISVIESIPLSQ